MNLMISRFLRGASFALLVGVTTVTAQEAGTVSTDNVNVRGRAGFIGEVVARMNTGDPVVVLDRVRLSKPRAGEPAEWYKIALPENTSVWVHADYVDPSTMAVTASRLKVRGGPGVNYSVLGFVDEGTTVSEMGREGAWMQIVPTQSLYAFISADHVILNSATPIIAETAPPVTQPTPDGVIGEQAEVSRAPLEETPLVNDEIETVDLGQPIKEPVPGNEPTIVAEPAPMMADADPLADRPLTREERTRLALEKHTVDGQYWEANNDMDNALLSELPEYRRKVVREGYVSSNVSLQAPSDFALKNLVNGELMNYLYTSDKTIPLNELDSRKVRVVGEECLDPRWPKRPVLLIQSIREIN